MEPGEWNRIEEVLQAALDLEPERRAAFLDQACGEDDELRREVESLLAHESDAALSKHPAIAAFQFRDLTGHRVSHYHIERRIGAGGMGEVYEARDDSLQRVVALKVLPAEFVDDTDRVRRFEQEALSASRLNHPNIITIFEILEADGVRFIATERIDGQTLREVLAGGKLEIEKALEVAIQVAAALKAAHTAWIIHRDIKPENIMIRSDGLVKVLDFGIAKLGEDGQQTLLSSPDSQTGVSAPHLTAPHLTAPQLTTPGAILGTANYMSPEQSRGEPLVGRTDLYSLGLILYEMLTGERFAGQKAHLPRSLERIVRKLLRDDRDERYSSASELLDDLSQAKQRMASRTARRMVSLGVLAFVVAFAVAGLAAYLSVNEHWEELVLRDGHTAAARQVVFSPDGSLVVSCGEDGQVIVWNFARRERVATLTGHPSHKVAYAPNGRWLATGGVDGTVVIWDTRTWKEIRRLRAGLTETGALTFSHDSGLLAASSNAGTIWRTGDWQPRGQWREISTTHGTFLFSPDRADRALSTSNHMTVLEPDGRLRIMGDQKVSLNWIALSPDRTTIAAIDAMGKVRFFRLPVRGDFSRIEPISVHAGHQDHGRSIAYSPDGALVASAADDILLWDAAARQKVSRFEYPSIVWSVAFSPDGRWLISSHGDGAVLVWDVAERERVANFNEHSGGVRAVTFSPDGRRVASGSEDRNVIIWDAATGRKTAVLRGHDTRVMGVAFLKNDAELASIDQNGVLRLWDVPRRRTAAAIRRSDFSASYCLAVSPDGRYLGTRASIWDRSGQMVKNLEPITEGQIYGMDFSDDGAKVAMVSTSGDVIVRDGRSFRRLSIQRVPDTRQIAVNFSADGKLIATAEDQGAVRLWNADPLRQLAVLGRHGARVKSVAFSPDGGTVASAGDDKMIALWDVRQRKLRGRAGTHASPVYALAFSPDGRRLVSGEHDRTVRVYTRRRTVWGMALD